MKPAGQPTRRATPTNASWPLRSVAGLAVVIGAAVWIGDSLYRTAPGDTATPAPVPTATPAGPGLPVVAVPDALPSGAELPANLPPGIALVGTAPSAQPPLATLLLDGRLQSQALGSAVAGSGLRVREITAEGVTLGLKDGPPLYSLRVTSAADAARLMAEARTQRTSDHPLPPALAPAELLVQRDADRPGKLPEDMQVAVRRQRATTGVP